MNAFLHWYVVVLTVIMLAGSWWLIRWTSKPGQTQAATGETTGHSWDGLEEYNNPLPRWWLWLFYFTLIFGVIYFALYPGLGNFQGLLGWSQERQYQQEMDQAEAKYGPIFAAFAAKDIPSLAQDPEALQVGQRLFLNYCAQCHGSDARGALGFPNLRDEEWLYGSDPQAIKTTILDGRQGAMPAWGAVVGEQGVEELTAYVLTLAGRRADSRLAEAGRQKFTMYCVACHGADGTGNPMLGAPDLTNDIWLYGGSKGAIAKTIRDGRNGHMPAHRDFLGEDKVHLLAAYVYSLSQSGD